MPAPVLENTAVCGSVAKGLDVTFPNLLLGTHYVLTYQGDPPSVDPMEFTTPMNSNRLTIPNFLSQIRIPLQQNTLTMTWKLRIQRDQNCASSPVDLTVRISREELAIAPIAPTGAASMYGPVNDTKLQICPAAYPGDINLPIVLMD